MLDFAITLHYKFCYERTPNYQIHKTIRDTVQTALESTTMTGIQTKIVELTFSIAKYTYSHDHDELKYKIRTYSITS